MGAFRLRRLRSSSVETVAQASPVGPRGTLPVDLSTTVDKLGMCLALPDPLINTLL